MSIVSEPLAESAVQSEPMRHGPVLTTAKAAEYCGLKPQTMRALKHQSKGPICFKLGRLTVYYPVDLDAWLASQLTRIEQGDEE